MGLIFNGNGDVIKAVDGSLTVEGLDLGGGTNINAGIGTFSGNLNVGGVLTYEDVKNVDSVGIITARNGLRVTGGTSTFTGNVSMGSSLMMGDDDTIWFGDGADGFIKSDGSNFLTQGSGTTYLRGSEVKISANGGSGGFWERVRVRADDVWLYYGSDQVRLKTTSDGLQLNGDISIADKIVHTGDTNTAIRFPANDTVSVETAGQQNVQVTGTRTLLKSPSGTNTTVRLQHQGNSGYGDIILDRQVNAFIIDNDPTNASNNLSYFSVKNKGTENLRIDSSGRVLLGTTTEGHANADDLTVSSSGDTGITIRSGTSSGGRIYFSDATSGTGEYQGKFEYIHSDNSFRFATATNEAFRITSDGYLKLAGTISGSNNKLGRFLMPSHDSGEEDVMYMQFQQEDTFNQLEFGGGSSSYNAATQIIFRTAAIDTVTGAERLRITSDGDMGLGCNNPGADPAIGNDATVFEIRQTTTGNITSGNNRKGAVLRLKHEAQWENGYQNSSPNDDLGRVEFVTGDTSTGEGVRSTIRCRNLQYYNNQALTFEVATSNSTSLLERMRITSGGKVGIKNTNPQEMLHVGDGSGTTGGLKVAGQSSSVTDDGLTIDWTASNEARLFSESSGDATMQFYTTSSGTRGERLRISSTGLIWAKTRSAEVRRMILSGSPSNASFNIEAHDGESGTSSGDVQGKLGLFYNDGSTLTNTACISFERGSGAPDGAMTFVTNQVERLRIDSTGRLLLGTTRTYGDATWYDDITINNSGGSGQTGGTGINLISSSNSWGSILFGDNNDNNIGAIKYDHNQNSMRFVVNTIDPALFIDSNGTVSIGSQAPTFGSPTPSLNIEKDSTGSGPVIALYNGQSANAASTCEILVRQNYRDSNRIIFGRENANNWQSSASSVASFTAFYTNSGSGIAERLRITSAGGVHIGNTFTAHSAADDLVLGATSGSNGMTILTGVATGSIFFNDGSGNEGVVQYVHSGSEHMRIKSEGYLKFDIGGGTNTFTINSSGNILVNTTASHAAKHAIHSGSTVGCAEFASALGGAGAACQVNVRVNTSASQGLYIRQGGSSQTIAGGNHCARFWNSENARMQFGVNGIERFRIESNGDLKATDTSIGSLSDSRLKKNIADFTYDLTKFKQFKPRTFDWINSELHTDETGIRGFVAQEIETVDSSLVGDYELFDETEDTKNPDLEIIKADDGTNKAKDAKLGSNDAMYISVIQQLIIKIETLETKVAALEGS